MDTVHTAITEPARRLEVFTGAGRRRQVPRRAPGPRRPVRSRPRHERVHPAGAPRPADQPQRRDHQQRPGEENSDEGRWEARDDVRADAIGSKDQKIIRLKRFDLSV